jgi:hypothetical protein
MRFSIRWMLLGMAYVALVATAVSTHIAFLEDSVWIVTWLVLAYAAVVAVIDIGKRRAMAVGFVTLAAIHVACLNLAPRNAPVRWVREVTEYVVETISGKNRYQPGGRYATPSTTPTVITSFTRPSARSSNPDPMNGVVTLAAGLIGCWIGLIAWKQRSVATRPAN